MTELASPSRSNAQTPDEAPFETPYLSVDLKRVGAAYQRLVAALPRVRMHYAMKCNPDHRILALLHSIGCGFEVASYAELAELLDLGVEGADVLFSNPVKSPANIAAAAGAGVWRFAADSSAELAKIKKYAPNAAVYVRLSVSTSMSSQVSSEGKFGVDASHAYSLLLEAADLNLKPYGVAFHVGSQMLNAEAWVKGIADSGQVMKRLEREGIRLTMLDIGGGFPARYDDPIDDLDEYGDTITDALRNYLPYDVEVTAEPGRALVAEAGVIVASVIGTAERHGVKWLHLDIGAFNGLMESLETGNQLRYPLADSRRSTIVDKWHITGPSCDSQDTILYDAALSADLRHGDLVYIHSAGAYTTSYASRFNGFPIPTTNCF